MKSVRVSITAAVVAVVLLGFFFVPLPVINTLPLGAPGNPNVHAQPGPILYQGG